MIITMTIVSCTDLINMLGSDLLSSASFRCEAALKSHILLCLYAFPGEQELIAKNTF